MFCPNPLGDDDALKCEPPYLEVSVHGPAVLGYLLGPDGERMATLLDRSVVPFGFQR